jgi:hypothetical protein
MATIHAYSHKTRYAKINALLRRKLIQPAQFSNEMIEQHELRSRRRPDGLHFHEHVDDVEVSDGWWERAGKRIREMDPELSQPRKLLHEMMTGR